MTTPHTVAGLSADEQKLMQAFLQENRLFYGPDQEIMQNHKLEPRTAREDVRIREDALALAEAYRRETADRIELGIAAEADLAAPEAEIARRRADLVRARDEATRASLALQHLVAGSADGWSTRRGPRAR